MKTQTSILKVLFLLIVLSLFYISCSQNETPYDSTSIALDSTGEAPEFKSIELDKVQNPQTKTSQPDVKVIKNATLSMEVDDVLIATRLARDYARQYEGYVSDERMNTSTNRKKNRFVIRIPQVHFDTLLDSITTISKVMETKNITTVDVTEKYIDIQSRLKTKKEVKERYESILRGKAKTVDEVLLAEEKIRILQEEIEAAEGKIRYMSNKISFSTIQVDMYQVLPVKPRPKKEGPSFLSEIKESLHFGLSIVKGFVLMLFHIWPLLITLTVSWVYYVRKKRKVQK